MTDRALSLKKALKRIVNRFGFEVSRYREDWSQLSTLPTIGTIIDVGVAEGTPALYEIFPSAYLILIEPLERFHDRIEHALLSTRSGELHRCAAGASAGSVEIAIESREPLRSSILARTELMKVGGKQERRQVPVETLDHLLESRELQEPVLLKIDTEGYELEVLKGARAVLEGIDYVVVECNLRRNYVESYTPDDLISWLKSAGFRFVNLLAAVQHRDGQFVMADMLFERVTE